MEPTMRVIIQITVVNTYIILYCSKYNQKLTQLSDWWWCSCKKLVQNNLRSYFLHDSLLYSGSEPTSCSYSIFTLWSLVHCDYSYWRQTGNHFISNLLLGPIQITSSEWSWCEADSQIVLLWVLSLIILFWCEWSQVGPPDIDLRRELTVSRKNTSVGATVSEAEERHLQICLCGWKKVTSNKDQGKKKVLGSRWRMWWLGDLSLISTY